jgi:sulfite reductase (NADPH) hemoprotein beta-component
MYRYDEYDQRIIDERVAQFRSQTERYLAGRLSDDEFRPLRLQNGLYLQRHAPMLRIGTAYGMIDARQLRRLARISRDYDRGYVHFTTRQNVQLNWVELPRVPDLLAELAEVQLHGIQTSGSCIRAITTDAFAGVAGDEIADPRPWCEIVRQWSTLHPEFAFLPRKFKVAVNGAKTDRAVTGVHDLALHAVRTDDGLLGFRVQVGGGLGRTPILAKTIREFLPWQHLLTYIEAILRTYNRFARRDNLYKSRIKILVQALGVAAFAQQVEDEWAHLRDGASTLTEAEVARVAGHFAEPEYENLPDVDLCHVGWLQEDTAFAKWVERNVHAHKVTGYANVTISLKAPGRAPGDCSAEQLEAIAAMAEHFSRGRLRVAHDQNLVLADVKVNDLYALWHRARAAKVATPTVGLINDVISCPGGDFCGLANARSIPIANAIQARFEDLDWQHDIGEIDLRISGCINACGHHHVGHIGILGVDKNGEEWYQVTLGGNSAGDGGDVALGKVIGPSFRADEMADVVETLIETYGEHRIGHERFIDTLRRIGAEPFKQRVYGDRSGGSTDHSLDQRKIANG